MRRTAVLPVALAAFYFGVALCDVHAQTTFQARWWRGTYDTALVEAKARNVPMMGIIIQDDEEASQRLLDGIILTKEFAALAERTVPIIVSRELHGNQAQEIDGTTLSVCKRFGHVPCETHIKQEAKLVAEIFGSNTVVTPQVMLITHDEEVAERIIDVAGMGEYSSALQRVVKKMGPGMDRKTYDEARKNVERARTFFANRAFRDAYDAASKVLAIGIKSSLATEASRIIEGFRNYVNRLSDEARAHAKDGQHMAAFDLIETLRTDAGKTEFEAAVMAVDKELRSTKAGRDAAAAYDKQRRLEPQLAKAHEFEGKFEWVKAYDIYEKLLSQAGDLPIAKRIIERRDRMLNDPDLKSILLLEFNRRADLLMERITRLRGDGQNAEAEAIVARILKEFPETNAAQKLRKPVK